MGEPLHDPLDPHTAGRSHEHSDVSIRPLAIFLAFLTGLVVVVAMAMTWLFNVFEGQAEQRERQRAPLAEERPRAAGPLLQPAPREDLATFRQRESAALEATGWVSREAGVVRIPIDRAIALTAERGLPDWPAVDVTAAAASDSERPLLPGAAEPPAGAAPSAPPEEGGVTP